MSSRLPPLLKRAPAFDEMGMAIENEYVLLLGGGVQVANRASTRRGGPPRFTVTNPASSAKLRVNFSSDFSDTFGVAIEDFEVDDAFTAEINGIVRIEDPVGIENGLDAYIVSVVDTQNQELSSLITTDDGINELITYGTQVPVATTSTQDGTRAFDVNSSWTATRSTVTNTYLDNTSRFNKSPQYKNYLKPDFKKNLVGNVVSVKNAYDINTGTGYEMYGPRWYSVLALVTDIKSSGTLKDRTTIMTRSRFVHGVEDVRITSSSIGNTEIGGNVTDTFTVSWKCSRDLQTGEYSTVFNNIHIVTYVENSISDRFRLQEQESYTGTIVYDPDTERYSKTFKLSGTITTTGQPYTGAIKGYVEYLNVETSPLNASDGHIVLSKTNAPVRINFVISNEQGVVLETQLQVKLSDVLFETDLLERTITVHAYHTADLVNHVGNPITFTYTPTHGVSMQTRSQIISGLQNGTDYVLKAFIENGGINPIYTHTIQNSNNENNYYRTRYDDFIKPTVDGFYPISSENHIDINVASIYDRSNLERVTIIVRKGNYLLVDIESESQINTYFPTSSIDAPNLIDTIYLKTGTDNPLMYYIDNDPATKLSITNAFTTNNIVEAIQIGIEYTVLLLATDTRGNSTVKKSLVTTRSSINIVDLRVLDTDANALDISANINFPNLAFNYYYAAFSGDVDLVSTESRNAMRALLTQATDPSLVVSATGITLTIQNPVLSLSGINALRNAFTSTTGTQAPIQDARTYQIVMYATPTDDNALYDVYDATYITPAFVKRDFTVPEIRNLQVTFNT